MVFCTENENVATACRMMMMMSMKTKKEEVHHHPSHTVVLPVHHHRQPLFRTDLGLLDIGVTGGKYYKSPGISVPLSGILAWFLGGHMPDCLSNSHFPPPLYLLAKLCLKLCLHFHILPCTLTRLITFVLVLKTVTFECSCVEVYSSQLTRLYSHCGWQCELFMF